MKSWMWAVLAALGLVLMGAAYREGIRTDPAAPWAGGFLCIGDGKPAKPLEGGDAFPHADAAAARRGSGVNCSSRHAEAMKPGNKANLEAQLRPRLIEVPATRWASW